MNVRWFPFQPWWLVLPPICSVVGGAALYESDGSGPLFWAVLTVGILCGGIGMDRWVDRYHPEWFPGINAKR